MNMNLNFHSAGRSPVSLSLTILACAIALIVAPCSRAQESILHVEPAQTKIEFSLGSSLHTVHGTFALKSCTIRFDPSSGSLSGAIVVDATSGESGNSGRDARMHREILESAKFPEIAFTPSQLKGKVAADGASAVEVSGKFRLHGQDHDLTLPGEIVADGAKLQLAIHFVIPYVQWGLKNPSNFFLRASDKVEIDVHATGRLENGAAAH